MTIFMHGKGTGAEKEGGGIWTGLGLISSGFLPRDAETWGELKLGLVFKIPERIGKLEEVRALVNIGEKSRLGLKNLWTSTRSGFIGDERISSPVNFSGSLALENLLGTLLGEGAFKVASSRFKWWLRHLKGPLEWNLLFW